jgi:hypothetical protein
MQPKKIPDGYNEGKWTWAVVVNGTYGDEVIESGFSTKRDALAWITKNSPAMPSDEQFLAALGPCGK